MLIGNIQVPRPIQRHRDSILAEGENRLAVLTLCAHAGTSMDRTRAATRPSSAGL